MFKKPLLFFVIVMLGNGMALNAIGGNETLPLPRFASFKEGEINMRVGPGVRYPFRWIYQGAAGMPVEILKEYEGWRHIKDWDGDTGWVLGSLLSGQRTALTQTKTPLYKNAKGAETLTQLSPRIWGRIERCPTEIQRCKVNIKTPRQEWTGWISKDVLFGVYAKESIND